KGKNKLAYALKPKIPPPPKREVPAKDSICHECGETRHWKRNCPQYLPELLKKKKNTASGAGGSDGFINRFVNNTIQVSRNNMVYFFAIPRDGIFKIDLSNSYTNESSIYAVSNKRAKLELESALLWHCRLGHISKKRIEKLQHDGLIDSTDLRAFEKCISCMSGKMARKPYTHQVERAKDLLGLIHTDVCGSFKIVSRQGVSYFVTFTNDFSRYGYVYLLKHKHEVFETFKVIQKEVENQLDKTIKSLRSDRDGEYMSQEFLDYLKDHRIITHRTPPYTLQHNEDLEIIQEEDTHPSIDTSLNHEEDDLEIDEPQSDIVPIRRSTRTRHALDRMCLYIDAEEHKLEDLGEPANYKAALLDPDKWLFKKKIVMDGVVHTYKVHLVSKGYNQTPGIDYEETFSPVADIRAIRILIAITAYYDYEICAYIEKILKRYCMENSKRGSIPMQEKLKLSKSQGASTPAELKRMQNVPYTSAVGSIMYAVRCTRPDVAFAQNVTSRFQQNLGDLQWTIVKNILKYLRNTKDMFLVYGSDLKRELRVSYYIDAGYLTDADDLKSQTGYVFVLNGGDVDWNSAKQSIFATSSAEVEYIAAFDASKEAVWVRKFISGLTSTSARIQETTLVTNGGALLKQKINSQGTHDTMTLFNSMQLRKATNNYSQEQIVSRGGYGVVYKGVLSNKRVVTIKKSKIMDGSQEEQFISNNTLYHYIHHKLGRMSWLSWENRLRIAAKAAGALAYLHSKTIRPIIHRDVKSTNILLDDKYTVTVSDFEAS
nr:hypothetical protein [Tanacetum cinerariifolium]